jgi:hypothetical protein
MIKKKVELTGIMKNITPPILLEEV